MEKPAGNRFEDRTRWAAMTFLQESDSRPVPYLSLDTKRKAVVREVTSVIYRMLTHKDPL